jgi:hypothetical protein
MDKEALRIHLTDMLADSHRLEAGEEPAQAFDKIARGIEALLATRGGEFQSEKWGEYFEEAARHDHLWLEYRTHRSTLATLAGELYYYVAPLNRNDAGRLKKHGGLFEKAVDSEDRDRAAKELARFVALLRNKRFHGDPAFSGRNFRVLMKIQRLLDFLRRHLEHSVELLP